MERRRRSLKGRIAGPSLMAGTLSARGFVLRLKPDVFRLVMDGIILAAWTAMLFNAFIGA